MNLFTPCFQYYKVEKLENMLIKNKIFQKKNNIYIYMGIFFRFNDIESNNNITIYNYLNIV